MRVKPEQRRVAVCDEDALQRALGPASARTYAE